MAPLRQKVASRSQKSANLWPSLSCLAAHWSHAVLSESLLSLSF